MSKFNKKNKKEIGMSPDALMFRWKKKMDHTLLRVIDFDATHLEEKTLKKIEDIKSYKKTKTYTWLNIDGVDDTQVIEWLAHAFHLDTLVMSEIMNTHARPKVVEYDNCISLSLKMLRVDDTNQIITENLGMILIDGVLISFQESRWDVFEPVRERIRKNRKRIRTSWVDYLTFALLDIVIDNYLYVLSLLGEKIEDLEETLLSNTNSDIISRINDCKWQLNHLRKVIKPAKEMIFTLSKIDSDFITEQNTIHFKELQDNITQASEVSDGYRDILSDQLNIYHTTISSNLNDVMKFLTVFSVVFIPLTFIVWIYGTNFAYVPELTYKYSYFIMWWVMIVVAIAMLLYFKRKKWL